MQRLWERAFDIRELQANGHWLPIVRHLALRGHGPALLTLASWETQLGRRRELGRMQDRFSALGLMHRAWKLGDPLAGQNLALTFFNIGDLGRYRYWLARAANAGDADAKAERRRFETRKPHGLAFRLRRGRPYRTND